MMTEQIEEHGQEQGPGTSCAAVQQNLALGITTTQLSQHVSQCSACTSVAQDIDLLRQLAQGLPKPAMPRTAHHKAPQRQLVPVLAGVLTLVLCISSVWTLTRYPHAMDNQAKVIGMGQKATSPEIPFDLLATLDDAQAVWEGSTGSWSTWLELPSLEETKAHEQTAAREETTAREEMETLDDDDEIRKEDTPHSVALINDPLGALDSTEALWSPPEILEYI